MNNYYTNQYPVVNLYKKNSAKSEIVTQMIFGESFKIINQASKWIQIQIKEDGYIGYVKNKKFISYLKPTHKVCVLSANIYKNSNFKKKIGKLSYVSKIKVEKINSKFSGFQNKWIETKNIRPLKYINEDTFKDIKIFKSIKYKWGGKTFTGIDCSALVQVFLNFNNKFCPRNTVQQTKFFKKNVNLKNIKKNDIIYWKGHVALALSTKKLIHAYGPRNKVLIMDIQKTIELIKKTANLKITFIKRL
jgi:cell wall-associated NlpC family hydrolase|tara:strand:- start:134 stop:874 length:741 start_codon:yes stop_codon:yes gene_type:complete